MSHDPLQGISSQAAPPSRDSVKLPPKAASREADFAGSLARVERATDCPRQWKLESREADNNGLGRTPMGKPEAKPTD